jgi:KamA family protein
MLMKPVYRSYSNHNYKKISQIDKLSAADIEAVDVVGSVLPFKTNNYVVDQLINWDDAPNDPIYTLNFPRKEMLEDAHYDKMAGLLKREASRNEIQAAANDIRLKLNPHPAGQMMNIPEIDGVKLPGAQHKYRETMLFFPSQGQTCHAYCTFCFRWPQFVGMNELKFAMKETDVLVNYLKAHREVTDVLFTGGDPMIMKTKMLRTYIEPLLDDELYNVQTIRIGTKALAYWPYRFTHDDDADDLIELFDLIISKGKNLSIMAHFNHPIELKTDAVKEAIQKLRNAGAQIRTQSPLLRNINDKAELWADMWRTQVNLNCIPYYMFVERDTGSKNFFELPLVEAWEIFREAYKSVSGICRTVRGPSMSANPGKVQVLGVSEVNGEKVIVLRFLQGRDPDWVGRPFFAKYDENATWLHELQPAFGEREFFFEKELNQLLEEKKERLASH